MPRTSSESGGTAIHLDEGQLLLRHRQGDADAFAELVQEYRKPVYSYLFRCGVPRGDRDDLFQEVFLKVHRSATSYRPDRPLHPWIFTIVANTVRNHFRRRRVRRLIFSRPSPRAGSENPTGPAAIEPVDPRPGGDRQAESRQATSFLSIEIRHLPIEQRQVLLLACVENLPLKEVARALDVPLNTVKTRLHRARRTLGDALSAFRGKPAQEVP